MIKFKGKHWDIDIDTNTINIHNKITVEQLARIIDSTANYERELNETIEWSIVVHKNK